MKYCKIVIHDEVNISIKDLDLDTRKALVKKFKLFDPTARFRPAYKLGRWDGSVSFFGIGGSTYLALLPTIVEILSELGYDFILEDNRQPTSLVFPKITETFWGDQCWPSKHRFAGQPIRLRTDQVDVINKFLENPQCIQSIATGFGKCQPLYSKVLTQTGFVAMGEIRTGDVVVTPFGDKAVVLDVYAPGTKIVSEITLAGGQKVRSCLDHIWPTMEYGNMMLKDIMAKFCADDPVSIMTVNSDTFDIKFEKVTEIRVMGKEEVRCIMIDDPEHLYITDDYVATHNTITTATLSKVCEAHGRTVTIVPNKSLVEQTEEDFLNCQLDVGVYYGDRKELGKKHTICTWQSLSVLDKKGADGLSAYTLAEFLDGVKTVIVDETHQAKAAVLQKLLTTNMANAPIRWGLTGTIPKQEIDVMQLIVSLGHVVNHVAASTLQEKGVLSKCHVNVIQTAEWKEFRSYQDELKYLVTDKIRLQFIAERIHKISQTGNTVVLVDRIESGKTLSAMLSTLVGEEVAFVSGTMDTADRREEYDQIRTTDNKILCATMGCAAVGLNIPRIFNMVLIEPGKSFVRVIQSIGRGLRMADDKDFVNIYDMTATTKYAKKHLTERKRFYKEANYPFSIEKVTYINANTNT